MVIPSISRQEARKLSVRRDPHRYGMESVYQSLRLLRVGGFGSMDVGRDYLARWINDMSIARQRLQKWGDWHDYAWFMKAHRLVQKQRKLVRPLP